MYREVKLKDVVPERVYWIKTPSRWALVVYKEFDYADGTDSYFFDILLHVKFFGFSKIERVVEVNEPSDAAPVS